jgi:hypothetical protein
MCDEDCLTISNNSKISACVFLMIWYRGQIRSEVIDCTGVRDPIRLI